MDESSNRSFAEYLCEKGTNHLELYECSDITIDKMTKYLKERNVEALLEMIPDSMSQYRAILLCGLFKAEKFQGEDKTYRLFARLVLTDLTYSEFMHKYEMLMSYFYLTHDVVSPECKELKSYEACAQLKFEQTARLITDFGRAGFYNDDVIQDKIAIARKKLRREKCNFNQVILSLFSIAEPEFPVLYEQKTSGSILESQYKEGIIQCFESQIHGVEKHKTLFKKLRTSNFVTNYAKDPAGFYFITPLYFWETLNHSVLVCEYYAEKAIARDRVGESVGDRVGDRVGEVEKIDKIASDPNVQARFSFKNLKSFFCLG